MEYITTVSIDSTEPVSFDETSPGYYDAINAMRLLLFATEQERGWIYTFALSLLTH